ncbi:hypothetical protein B0H14DRAFT_3148310 [Mycena olivaceomarginata]|nr:hypothetical protein B0H14DRAFT_3148310 [Mycena olivaceomarginata]
MSDYLWCVYPVICVIYRTCCTLGPERTQEEESHQIKCGVRAQLHTSTGARGEGAAGGERPGPPARLPGTLPPASPIVPTSAGVLHLHPPRRFLVPYPVLPHARHGRTAPAFPLRFPPSMAPPPRAYVGPARFYVGRMEGWGELYPRECALDGSGRGAGDVTAGVAPGDDGQAPGGLRRTYIHPVLRHLSALHSSRSPLLLRWLRTAHPCEIPHLLLRRLRAGGRRIGERIAGLGMGRYRQGARLSGRKRKKQRRT